MKQWAVFSGQEFLQFTSLRELTICLTKLGRKGMGMDLREKIIGFQHLLSSQVPYQEQLSLKLKHFWQSVYLGIKKSKVNMSNSVDQLIFTLR